MAVVLDPADCVEFGLVWRRCRRAHLLILPSGRKIFPVRDLYYITSLKTCYTSGMSNQPVYRNRNHAYSCRCGRCAQSRPTEWGIVGPAILIFFVVALIGFWPAMVWHGYTDTGGWRWDIHSTIGELVYFGTIGFIALMAWAGNRSPKIASPPTVSELRPPPPSVCVPAAPLCCHRNAVRIDSVLDPGLIYRCWCPDCDPECMHPLPAAFRLACCGAEPGTGTKPARHMYNCPQGDPR